jgi:L-aspartate oxidase
MTHLNPDYLIKRFPRIYRTCREHGIDISREPIPVSPAAHYLMGGIKTDLWGATTVPGLFAAGETACTGVHGANRLASNSLLEGLVYGERAGLAASRYARKNIDQARASKPLPFPRTMQGENNAVARKRAETIREALRELMWKKVGIVRNREDLAVALRQLRSWERDLKGFGPDRRFFELRNMLTTAQLITRSALSREGSVGAHYRSDYPTKGRNWRKRTLLVR